MVIALHLHSNRASNMKTRTLSIQSAILGSAFLLGVFPLAWPQETPSFRVEVDMVNILATVRDEQGRLVDSLAKEDFILQEEGQPHEIEYFSSETDLPLTLGLLVDTSMSQSRILEEERQASYQFLEDILRPESDLAFVMSFDVEAQLLENLTNSQKQLQAALESLQIPTGRGRPGEGTVLYDSVFLAADEILKFESGRKAMVIISDGVDFWSIVDLDQAVETVFADTNDGDPFFAHVPTKALMQAAASALPPRRPFSVINGMFHFDAQLIRASLDSTAPTKPTAKPQINAGRDAPVSSNSNNRNNAVGALPMATTAPSSLSPHRSTAAAERVVF